MTRVQHFIEVKTFKYIDVEPDERMPLLIGAAAVQLVMIQSWGHFVKEFINYSDGQNVGLHEMAHALTYVNFTVREGRDKTFHDHFTEFSAVARPIFDRMRAGEANLLDAYAATNYQEFWAVCIETFFERSNAFRKLLPELYISLCSLLDQDPLTAEKILQPDGGGLTLSVID